MPDFIPYTAGVDAAGAAGAAMGRASQQGPIGAFTQGFQPGFNAFIGDVREDRKKKKKVDENRKFLQDLERTHPDLVNKKWWPYIHGVGDEGGDVNKALFQGIELDRHEKDSADKNEISRMLAESTVDRRGVQNQNDNLRAMIASQRVEMDRAKHAADTEYRGGLLDLGRERNAQTGERMAETQRSNLAREGIAQQNADRPRGKTPEQEEVEIAESQRKAATRFHDRARKAYEDLKKYAPPTKPDELARHRQEMAARRHELDQAEQDEFEAQRAVVAARRKLTKATAVPEEPAQQPDQPQDFDAYFDSLPSGATFKDPETGEMRRKR